MPLAALLIDFGDKHNVALRDLFGSTMSRTDKRSPSTVLGLLQKLRNDPSDVSVTAQQHDEQHLKRLSNAGLITYEDWDATKSIKYKLLDKPYRPTKKASTLRKVTYEYLQEHNTATLDELVDYYSETIPDEIAGDSETELRAKIAHSLGQLEKPGYLEREGRKNDGQVKINPAQKSILVELLDQLERFSSGDAEIAEHLQARANAILTNPELIARALERAAESSPLMQNGTEKSVGRLVLAALGVSEARSIKEIRQTITSDFGRNFTTTAIRSALHDLEEQQQVVGTKHRQNTLRFTRITSKD